MNDVQMINAPVDDVQMIKCAVRHGNGAYSGQLQKIPEHLRAQGADPTPQI